MLLSFESKGNPLATNHYTNRYEPAELDNIGWKIVEELQRNARISWAELGRRVGLTTPAVVERVHRLEKLGVICGFHADVSLERLGVPVLIFVRLSMAGPESLVRAFQQQVKTWDEVLECHRVTGSDSFLVKARVVSMEHLERFIDTLGHYGTTSTATVLSSPVTNRTITQRVVERFYRDK
jgi:Lrp/AsnC family leucine-responsive transcriptional regulator